MKLYHHKTDGGAEYLTDKYIVCPNGEKEGVFEGANFIVRIDGDITKDAELTTRVDTDKLIELADEILENLRGFGSENCDEYAKRLTEIEKGD